MSPRVAIALATAAGCTWGSPPGPVLLSVDPPSLVEGTEAVLVLSLAGIEPPVQVDFDDPGQSSVCDYYRVELRVSGGGGVALLEDVVRAGGGELRGRISSAAQRGIYDAVVTTPWGDTASLAGAFEVEKCPPPFGACDDGNDCTAGDSCLGADRCSPGTTLLPDGTDCTYLCTWGAAPGSCHSGSCVPEEGACAPAPAACGAP